MHALPSLQVVASFKSENLFTDKNDMKLQKNILIGQMEPEIIKTNLKPLLCLIVFIFYIFGKNMYTNFNMIQFDVVLYFAL